MTPEGRVKKAVNDIIKTYLPRISIYKFMPVPTGYGPSTLDYVLCIKGQFLAIETKPPGGKLTPRQEKTKADIEAAGGTVFVIDGVNQTAPLIFYLENATKHDTHPSGNKPET